MTYEEFDKMLDQFQRDKERDFDPDLFTLLPCEKKCILRQKHMEQVRAGNFHTARLILELLRRKRVTLGLDDDSRRVEKICDSVELSAKFGRHGSMTFYL